MGTLTFDFQVDADLQAGIRRLQPLLGFQWGSGITVTAVAGDRAGVTLQDGRAVLYYHRKSYFFRALGLLVQHARQRDSFEVFEDAYFEELSIMIDTSRIAVPTVRTVERMLDYMALMGYSMAMLYTEDTIVLPERPRFGYMRGRYTGGELRAMDDYAFAYGIEMIPCLECYGHMEKYLFWGEASSIRDTDSVLLAREEKTFQFLEELIGQVSSCFRSRRIHVGMDEAWDMGRGKFLDKHGYVPPFQIFNEYMERLMEILHRYDLKPMMWSDMYFRNCSSNGMEYYEEDTQIPPEVAEKIPPEMELVFWHYGEKPYCDDYMLKKHMALGRRILYAGGLWSWIGHFPEHNYMMETSRFSLTACRNNGVRQVMMTLWLNDNAECDLFTNLFGLSFFAELCYDETATEDKRRARFEAVTGGSYDTFYAMSAYHNTFGEGETYSRFHDRFYGKPLFWQDILEGMYDANLFKKPMSSHYATAAKTMKGAPADCWNDLYAYAAKVFDYLAVKTQIAERLVPAYQAGERETLTQIADELLPRLKEAVEAVRTAHAALWFDRNKDIGWCNMDYRYGGVAARCDTARLLLHRYLKGEIPAILGLAEPRLPSSTSGFNRFARIATPNLEI